MGVASSVGSTVRRCGSSVISNGTPGPVTRSSACGMTSGGKLGRSARHSLPSKRASTGPRKYIACGAGAAPSKRMRSATLSSSASSATDPMRMRSDSPVPAMPSPGTPHSGPMRGKSTNSSTMIGAPKAAVRAASHEAWRRLGWPTGMCASTSAVSKPHTETSIASATTSDCEYRKWVSTMKKPRKKTTKASRRARSSSVFSAISATSKVMPGSLPSRL